MNDRALRIVLPLAALAGGVVIWHLIVHVFAIPPYVLPGPKLVLATLISDASLLWNSLLVTLFTTFEGFLACGGRWHRPRDFFNQSRLIEYSLFPYTVILQVTPIVAVAPLLSDLPRRNLWPCWPCAWIVAFFPIFYTTLGLSSVDHNLLALFDLYKASRLASAVEFETALSAAANAHRIAHRRRPVADRCRRRGDCRRIGRCGLGSWPIASPSSVIGSTSRACSRHCFVVTRGRGDLLRAIGDIAPGVAPMARKRDRARTLIRYPLNGARRALPSHHDLDQAAV